jgi:hypothetical protein
MACGIKANLSFDAANIHPVDMSMRGLYRRMSADIASVLGHEDGLRQKPHHSTERST